jgi:DNA-binding response OmpR family regulator
MHPVILHIEDNIDLAEAVEMTFETLGFRGQILRASTVYCALVIIQERKERNQPLDLILVDMNLPDGTGIDVIRQVKSNPAWVAIPIVVLSNEGDRKIVAEAYALGANCYYPKLAKNKSAIASIEALYAGWTNVAILPNVPSTNLMSEILGRAVSAIAQTSRLYTTLARQFSRYESSRLWLDLAMNASNNANLLAFFQSTIKSEAINETLLKN